MVCPNDSSELFAIKFPFEVIFGLGVELGLVVGVGVGEDATVEVFSGLFEGVGVVLVAERVLVGVGEALGNALGDVLGETLGDAAVSICLIATPSSQTMFLPTFIAVYLRFRQIIVCPNFFGASVGFGIAAKSLENGDIKRPKMMPRLRNCIFK